MQPVAEYLRRRRGRPGREIQFRRLGGRRACALLSALRFFSWFSSWFMCNWCTTLVNVVHHRRNHLHYPVVNVVHHQIWVMVRRFRLRLDAEMEVEQVLIRQLHVAVCSREDGDVAGLGQLLDLINDRTPRQPAVVGKRVVARAALPGVLVVPLGQHQQHELLRAGDPLPGSPCECFETHVRAPVPGSRPGQPATRCTRCGR